MGILSNLPGMANCLQAPHIQINKGAEKLKKGTKTLFNRMVACFKDPNLSQKRARDNQARLNDFRESLANAFGPGNADSAVGRASRRLDERRVRMPRIEYDKFTNILPSARQLAACLNSDAEKSHLLPDGAGVISHKMHAILSNNNGMSFENAFQAAVIAHAHVRAFNLPEERAIQAGLDWVAEAMKYPGCCPRQLAFNAIIYSDHLSNNIKDITSKYLGITPSAEQIEYQLTADHSKSHLLIDGAGVIAQKMHAILSNNKDISFENALQAAVIAHVQVKGLHLSEIKAIQVGLDWVSEAMNYPGCNPLQQFFDVVWDSPEYSDAVKDIFSQKLGITPSLNQIADRLRANRSKSRLLRDDAGGIVQKMHAILSENKSMSFEGAFQTSAIKQAYEKYANSGNRREFNAAVRYLRNMLSRNKAALDDGLVPEKSTPDSAIILSEVIMLLKMGVSTGDTILDMLLDTSTKPEYRKWRKNGFSRPEALFYQYAGFDIKKMLPLRGAFATPQEAKILLKSRIKDPIQFLREFRRCKIPLSKNIVFGRLTDEGLIQPMQRLGNGQFNTVYKGTYRLPDGTVFNGVYKAEDAGRSDGIGMCPSALESGIDPGNPRYGLRNIASVRLNNLLGFSVLPHTEFGIHQGKLGVVMAHAKGIHPCKFVTNDITSNYHPREIDRIRRDKNLAKHMAKMLNADRVYVKDGRLKVETTYNTNFNYKDPTLQRELVKLQLLDNLCGQVDRHGGNYLVEEGLKGEIVGVTGIDNDFCFGKLVDDPENVRVTGNFVGLPEVVDKDMYKSFQELSPEDLERELSSLLSKEEIDATKKRLTKIQTHLHHLKRNGCVIAPESWGSKFATKRLSSEYTSYLGRERFFLGKAFTLNPKNVVNPKKMAQM